MAWSSKGSSPSITSSASWRDASLQRQKEIQLAIFPDALPHIQERFFISIIVGQSHLHWAIHTGYDHECKALHFWKTTLTTLQHMKNTFKSPSDALAHHIPFHLRYYLFGGSNEIPEESSKENAWRCSWERFIPMIHVYILTTTSGRQALSRSPLTFMFAELPSHLSLLSVEHFWQHPTGLRRPTSTDDVIRVQDYCNVEDDAPILAASVEETNTGSTDAAAAAASLPQVVSPGESSYASRLSSCEFNGKDTILKRPVFPAPQLNPMHHHYWIEDEDGGEVNIRASWDDKKPAAKVGPLSGNKRKQPKHDAFSDLPGFVPETTHQIKASFGMVVTALKTKCGECQSSSFDDEKNTESDSIDLSGVLPMHQERHVIVTAAEKELLAQILHPSVTAGIDEVFPRADLAAINNQQLITLVSFAIGKLVYGELVQHEEVVSTSTMERIRQDLVGSRVAVKFEPRDPEDDWWYRGSVVKTSRGIDEERNWKECLDDDLYSVLFDDGDSQELNPFELYPFVGGLLVGALIKYNKLGEHETDEVDYDEDANVVQGQNIAKSKTNSEMLLTHSVMVQESAARVKANRLWKARHKNAKDRDFQLQYDNVAEFVGKRVAKKFDDGKVYFGTVTGVTTADLDDPDDETLWWITYDDTETEQFDLKDLTKGFRLNKSTTSTCTPSKPRKTSRLS